MDKVLLDVCLEANQAPGGGGRRQAHLDYDYDYEHEHQRDG
jgi:hypothetical protein